MGIRRHTIRWGESEAYLQHSELVSIYGAASWDEVEELYASVSKEAAQLAGVLERNNAVLIRTGIASKLVAHAGQSYGRQTTECIGANSRFYVRAGESGNATSVLDRNPEVIELFYRNPTYRSGHAIGRRVLAGADDVEYKPLQPEFDETDIQITAGLLTDLLDGSFPHVSPSGLTHLILHGSLEAEAQLRYTQKYYELCAMASAVCPKVKS